MQNRSRKKLSCPGTIPSLWWKPHKSSSEPDWTGSGRGIKKAASLGGDLMPNLEPEEERSRKYQRRCLQVLRGWTWIKNSWLRQLSSPHDNDEVEPELHCEGCPNSWCPFCPWLVHSDLVEIAGEQKRMELAQLWSWQKHETPRSYGG
jgi:hypothetical protein